MLESMSPVKTPAGAVGIARALARRRSTLALASAIPLIVVAHDVQDPGNVGGIMRTAEAAGATAFIATPSTADPLGWKALRGSMGSALRLPIARAGLTETLAALRKAGIAPAALVPRGGEPLFDVDFRAPTALILGGEGPGLPADIVHRHRSARLDSRCAGRSNRSTSASRPRWCCMRHSGRDRDDHK